MANQWFRMYHEFATDPKIQMLTESDQRRYIMILCMRCSNGDVTLHDNEVAFQLRVTENEWLATKDVLIEKNLINKDNKPVAWDKRQYVSDSSAERVRRHREKKKQERNVTVTPPDTDTDTDTDIIEEKKPDDVLTKKDLINLKPDDVESELWDSFMSLRKKKKAQQTGRAINALNQKLTECKSYGITKNQMISTCLSQGWKGVNYEWYLKLNNINPKTIQSQPRSRKRMQSITEANR